MVFLLTSMVALSQAVLLAAWAAFGSRHVLMRFSQSLCILALLCLSPLHAALRGGIPPEPLIILMVQCVLFVGSFSVFELVGRRTGWRVVRLRDWPTNEPWPTRGKLTLRQLFGLTALAALVFALVRLPADSRAWLPNPSQLIIALAMYALAGCAIGVLFSPLVRVILGQGERRRWTIRAALSVGTFVGLFLGLGAWLSVFAFTDVWQIAAFVTSISASLWMLRAAGYRLVAMKKVPGTLK